MNEVTYEDKNRPESIFKYQPLSVQTLANIQSQSIYFCSPKNFNDPFDCALPAQLMRMTSNQVKHVRESYSEDIEPDDPAIEELKQLGRVWLRNIVQDSTLNLLERHKDELLQTVGIACFTEKKDNMLMWSHYADSGRGICLEFDAMHKPFNGMRRVKYLKDFPIFDPMPMVISGNFEQYFDLFCTKSIDWQYEKEWRSLHKQAGTSYHYEEEALKAVYFGPNVTKENLNVVCLIIHGQNPGVKFFQGKKSERAFKVEFEEFTYVPWRYRPDRNPD